MAVNTEVDYLIIRKGKIYPVEVKSGKGGSLQSLHFMLISIAMPPESRIPAIIRCLDYWRQMVLRNDIDLVTDSSFIRTSDSSGNIF